MPVVVFEGTMSAMIAMAKRSAVHAERREAIVRGDINALPSRRLV
jgi:hypothetical protein